MPAISWQLIYCETEHKGKSEIKFHQTKFTTKCCKSGIRFTFLLLITGQSYSSCTNNVTYKFLQQAIEEKYRSTDDQLTQLLDWVGEIEDRLANQDVAQEDLELLRNQINFLKVKFLSSYSSKSASAYPLRRFGISMAYRILCFCAFCYISLLFNCFIIIEILLTVKLFHKHF